jgi:hypothetical protein
MKTDAEYNAWLNNPLAMRVVLLEVQEVLTSPGVSTTIRMSLGPDFTSTASDSPAHTPYPGIAHAAELLSEALTLPLPGARPGGGGLSKGVITVDNPNGVRDSWYAYAWTNRRAVGLLGDMTWPLADFRLIFDGTLAGITPAETGFALSLRDKLQRLNGPMVEDTVGGSGLNKDAPQPFALGEVHNISPVLVDDATLTYRGHTGRVVSGGLEVRANGVPVSITADALTGTFQLSLNDAGGTITASMMGDAPGGVYSTRIGALVRRAITGFGKESDRLTDADLDLTNFTQFDVDHPVDVGIASSDRQNVIDVCQLLAGSVGAELVPTLDGLLRLVQLQLPATSPTLSVYPSSMEGGTLELVDMTPVVAAVKLGYARNYTPQPTLETGIVQAHKERFAKEWLPAIAVDDQVRIDNRLSSDPVNQDNTQLLRRVHADAEVQRRLNMWKVPRRIFEFTALQDMLGLRIGQQITVFHDRHDLKTGVNAVVIGRAVNFKTLRSKIRIIA